MTSQRRPSERRPAVVREGLAFRLSIQRQEAAALVQMAQAMRAIIRDLDQRILRVAERVAVQRAQGAVSPGAIVEMAEWTALRQQAEAQLLRYTNGVSRQIETMQRARIVQAIEHTRTLTRAALPDGLTFQRLAGLGLEWANLDPSAVETMVGRMADGSSLRNYLGQRVVGDTIQRVADTLTTGLTQNPRATARLLKGAFVGGAAQALRVTRTETLRVYRDTARESYQRNRDIVKAYRRHAALDDRTCAPCWLLDGTLFRNESDLDEHVQGRCFITPETVSWADLGLRGPDAEADEPGASRFLRLPEARQRAIVGNNRQFDAWQSGQIGLADLVTRTVHPTFGAQFVQASARQSLAGETIDHLPDPQQALATGADLLHPALPEPLTSA